MGGQIYLRNFFRLPSGLVLNCKYWHTACPTCEWLLNENMLRSDVCEHPQSRAHHTMHILENCLDMNTWQGSLPVYAYRLAIRSCRSSSPPWVRFLFCLVNRCLLFLSCSPPPFAPAPPLACPLKPDEEARSTLCKTEKSDDGDLS